MDSLVDISVVHSIAAAAAAVVVVVVVAAAAVVVVAAVAYDVGFAILASAASLCVVILIHNHSN